MIKLIGETFNYYLNILSIVDLNFKLYIEQIFWKENFLYENQMLFICLINIIKKETLIIIITFSITSHIHALL